MHKHYRTLRCVSRSHSYVAKNIVAARFKILKSEIVKNFVIVIFLSILDTIRSIYI